MWGAGGRGKKNNGREWTDNAYSQGGYIVKILMIL
jgi:hypothetical protein